MMKRLPYLMLFLAVLAMPLRAQTTSSSGTAKTQQVKPDEGMLTAGGHLKKPSKYSGTPVLGEFQENQTEAQPDRERRRLREERYSNFNLPREIADPGLLVDGKEETTNLRFIDYVTVGKSPDPRGIPVSTSAGCGC